MQKAQFSLPYIVGQLYAVSAYAEGIYSRGNQEPADIGLCAPRDDCAGSELDALGLQVAPTIVEAEIAGVGNVRRRIDLVPGHPLKPLDFADVTAKFEACVRYGAPQASDEAIRQVVESVRHLEDLPNVRDLIRHLVFTA